MHQLRRDLKGGGDPHQAVQFNLRTTGHALLFTSLILTAGFLTFAGGYMGSVFQFGVLSAAAIAIAFVANVRLSPAIESHGLYRQLLAHCVERARERGARRVAFGVGSSLEKRRFGARPVERLMYVQSQDRYHHDVLELMAARS